MADKVGKNRILKEIKNLLSRKNPKDNKQAKKLGMRNNIKLVELRKGFCSECFYSLDSGNVQVRINNGFKVVKCKNCGKVYRWKIK